MKQSILSLFLLVALFGCTPDPGTPMIVSVEPDFGPAETLVTFEGSNLENIREITFSDQVVNFNTAYNSDVALFFRVPTNIPLGEHVVEITTEGGTAVTNFRVTLEAPEISEISPEFGSPGEVVTILGKNFFEPLEVYFFDSIQAEIITQTPDSLEVLVPTGIEKGRVTVSANGGVALSPVNFFSINPILVNDFDGNGVRSETNKWGFVGQVNENAGNAVQSSDPDPIDGNFLKLTGEDELDITWIGGAQSHFGFPGDDFVTFGITTNINNTLLEMDVHGNGADNTYLSLILLEHEGLTSDFVNEVHVTWEGWRRLSIPLNRFSNFEGVNVDPTKVKVIKIHMLDENDSNETLEVAVDNLRFVEIL